MNTNILRFLLAGLLSLPALIAMADDQPANAAPAPDAATLRQQLDEANDKLATALRSYSALEAENTQLKAQQTAANAETEKLRHDKADLEARLAAPAPSGSTDLSAQLAEANDKLSTALRSYTLLQAENDQLKANAAKSTADVQTAAGKAAADATAQIAALTDQLRQYQAQAAALAAENSELKTKLAIMGPPPGSTLAAPSRPGTAAAVAAATPTTPEPIASAPAAVPVPRQHVVVEGDSLTKIARKYYGDANRWDEILAANRDVIKNENVLPVGVTLRIP